MPNKDYVYGRRPVWEVLEAGKRSLHKLWVMQGVKGGIVDKIVATARQRGVPVEFTTRQSLDHLLTSSRFSETGEYSDEESTEPTDPRDPPRKAPDPHHFNAEGNHQGVVAMVSATHYLELDEFLAELKSDQPAVLILLDEVQDPHNVGAILRNAGFFGATGVAVPKWRSAPVGDTAWRVAAGAAEHLALIRLGNFVQALERLKEEGFEVLGADMDGQAIWKHEMGKRIALVVGNEEHGMRRLVREHCDKIVGIPRPAQVGSLNVASATAILLYEISRAKRK